MHKQGHLPAVLLVWSLLLLPYCTNSQRSCQIGTQHFSTAAAPEDSPDACIISQGKTAYCKEAQWKLLLEPCNTQQLASLTQLFDWRVGPQADHPPSHHHQQPAGAFAACRYSRRASAGSSANVCCAPSPAPAPPAAPSWPHPTRCSLRIGDVK